MTRPIYLLAILLLFFFQSCCILRNKDYPKYSKIRDISKISNPEIAFTRFSEKVETFENKNAIICIYNKDTIELAKPYEEYSCLFSSGLISHQVLEGASSNSVSIFKIEEIEYCFKSGKYRIFKLEGGISNFFNGFNYYLEIKNTKAHKSWKLERFIKDAKVSKLATFVLI